MKEKLTEKLLSKLANLAVTEPTETEVEKETEKVIEEGIAWAQPAQKGKEFEESNIKSNGEGAGREGNMTEGGGNKEAEETRMEEEGVKTEKTGKSNKEIKTILLDMTNTKAVDKTQFGIKWKRHARESTANNQGAAKTNQQYQKRKHMVEGGNPAEPNENFMLELSWA
ncbi:hypothetical protein PIB30_037638 [Stylosanthes scabra]|uniref:Uncharacterized protein n=1 Tax=Stylosanthes scabra TaxID=79078 RepID=A0ABU6REA0_9FABA|nr:hypothetical protein [Stylosanthes scabra]